LVLDHRESKPMMANLPDPLSLPPDRRWRPQSLARGAAGVALLPIERAHAGVGGWDVAHSWLKAAVSGGVRAGDDAGLYNGAPAVALALRAASAGASDRYSRALEVLDRSVSRLAHRRVDHAAARIARGALPALAEYDVINGLSGIGAYLLFRSPGDGAFERLLFYLVQLTEPLRVDGELLPGWWTGHDPHFGYSTHYLRGHGNFGMAHGVAGPLALLSLALLHGHSIDGQREAIERICAWLDMWRQQHEAGPWWPQWITDHERRTGHLVQRKPGRPSWCYGTPGVARAQQLAGLASGDLMRTQTAERAIAGCLSDPEQLDRIVDVTLCHGWAGLFVTAWRAAENASTSAIAERLPIARKLLIQHAAPGAGDGIGLLEGDAGLALAVHIAEHHLSPISGWDRCLLIS
jgi:class I lanthipeptide synthase